MNLMIERNKLRNYHKIKKQIIKNYNFELSAYQLFIGIDIIDLDNRLNKYLCNLTEKMLDNMSVKDKLNKFMTIKDVKKIEKLLNIV